MLEIRFWGRGGQGAVLAAELLAHAAFLEGKEPQSFPFFGVERRGAPVTAFARVSDAPIGIRTSITEPDVVVVLDRGLLRTVPVTDGLKSGGWLLVNAPPGFSGLAAPVGVRVATVDATGIARTHRLGSASLPIVNTAILGALARLTGVVTQESLERAIAANVPRQKEENREACLDGFAGVTTVTQVALAAPSPPALAPLPLPEGPVASLPSDRIHTSSWRTLRPEIHLEHCTRCNFCWKFCPDTAIAFDPSGYPVLQADHCKGCGICAAVCPPKVIAMVAEG